jgi:hypothetical protein
MFYGYPFFPLFCSVNLAKGMVKLLVVVARSIKGPREERLKEK